MKLADLDPQFLRVDAERDPNSFQHVDSVSEANGVSFLCPKCWQTNNGPRGTHSVICWAPPVPQTISPTPGRWEMHGSGYGDLSLVAGSSSVLLTGGCNAHFFIQGGDVRLVP